MTQIDWIHAGCIIQLIPFRVSTQNRDQMTDVTELTAAGDSLINRLFVTLSNTHHAWLRFQQCLFPFLSQLSTAALIYA